MSRVTNLENEEVEEKLSYKLALISQELYKEDPLCPHCHTRSQPFQIDQYMELETAIAELYVCTDCCKPFIMTEFPTIYGVGDSVMLHVQLQGEEDIFKTEKLRMNNMSHMAHQLFAMADEYEYGNG